MILGSAIPSDFDAQLWARVTQLEAQAALLAKTLADLSEIVVQLSKAHTSLVAVVVQSAQVEQTDVVSLN